MTTTILSSGYVKTSILNELGPKWVNRKHFQLYKLSSGIVWRLFLALVLVKAAISLNAQPFGSYVGTYPIKNFAPTDYGAGIQNIDFTQNREMDLFVANNLGVLAFNGTSWGRHNLNTGKKQRS
ncbi:MAG: hypothetical protein ACKO96_48660, partial [Flammeovirgaceae bacterium]